MRGRAHSTWASISFAFACISWRGVQASFTPYLEQSFYFEWDTNPVPIPIVAQCDTLHITWSRSSATGPNPVSPYYLQVYTSIFPTPFILSGGDNLSLDWPVPFPPNTLFQICMFDKNGNTGGCQRIVTVIPPTSTPTCANVTFPATPLNVVGTVSNGPFSQYGWIPQCTDLELQPMNGTPPYITTIATTQHPPYNITSNSMAAVNWTVSLSWASSFFVSVVDSAGNSWARGPLHSGASEGTDPPTCLSQIAAAVTSAPAVKKKVSPTAAVGAGVGGAATGLIVGLAIAYLCMRGRVKKAKEEANTGSYDKSSTTNLSSPPFGRAVSGAASHYSAVPLASPPPERTVHDNSLAGTTLGNRMNHYNVEPFRMPNEDGTLRPATSYLSPSEEGYAPSSHPQSEPDSTGSQTTSQPPLTASNPDRSHVYVVHHDGGRAPVTVYTPDGTEVVELPPRYIEGAGQPSSSSGGGSSLEESLNPRRKAGPAPRKPRAALPTPPGPPDS